MNLRTAIHISLAIMLVVTTDRLYAQTSIDNDTVTITDWFPAFTGYDVENAIDTDEDLRFLSDYASLGGGVDTYIEFDLGEPYTLSQIIMTDRVTSGGGNFTWVGGLFDYNRVFSYTLSIDADFTNGDGVSDDILIEVEAEEPEFGPVLEDELELLQTITPIPNVRARYVRWDVIDTNGANPGANDFEFFVGGGLLGDFNGNGIYDAEDMDLLSAEVRGATDPPEFDLNGDGLVNTNDRGEWIEVLANSYFGDSNLDGEFGSADFVTVFTAGEYEDGVAGNSGWATGDWDGDTEFDSADFVVAFSAGGYELGPRPGVAAVPEPTAATLMPLAILALAYVTRRRQG